MKWAQLKAVLDSDGVDQGNERKKLFKEYKTRKELRRDLRDPTKFVEWTTYPGADNQFESFGDLNRRAQRKYEIFCGGFLFYHDFRFKSYHLGEGYTDENGYPEMKKYPNKEFEHKIYFRWLKENEKDDIMNEDEDADEEVVLSIDQNETKKKRKKNKVVIYITPTPPAFNGNPPKPPPPPPPESND